VYKEARASAKMSAEEAAFRVRIGISSLYRYESGEQAAPDDVVCMMAKVYKAPELPQWHCMNRCQVGIEFGCPIQKEIALVRAG
jgi:transcriptional regulator with XRE-family HTH domain